MQDMTDLEIYDALISQNSGTLRNMLSNRSGLINGMQREDMIAALYYRMTRGFEARPQKVAN